MVQMYILFRLLIPVCKIYPRNEQTSNLKLDETYSSEKPLVFSTDRIKNTRHGWTVL